MNSANLTILITIVCYMLMTIIVGLYFSNKNKNTGDFYLGGRKLGPFVTAMSAEASDMSAWLLMGLPGVAYISGCGEAVWTVIGLGVGTYINWLIVAKRLRLYSNKIGAITIPDFFANRFRDKYALKLISALIIIIFFVPYTGSGFAACGKLFKSLFGVDYHAAMIISAAVIIIYTTLGGFLAASTTDFVQGIIMTTALVAIVLFGVHEMHGEANIYHSVKDIPGYLSLTHITADMKKAGIGSAGGFGIIAIISTLAWGLGYFGMPHVLLRFMAIKDPKKLKTSRRFASVWVFISMFIAIFIGITGLAMSIAGKIDFLGADGSETIIVVIANLMSKYGIFFAIVAGIVLAGILASTMSTSDSQLLAASSSVSENILDGVFGIKLTEAKKMLIARVAVICIAAIGVIIAWDPNSSVFEIVSFAWGGFGATFGPVMLVSLFWKRSNNYGCIAGMVVGAITIFVWKFLVRPNVPALDFYELLPAFILALLTIIIVSIATPKPEKAIVDEFNSVKKEMHAK